MRGSQRRNVNPALLLLLWEALAFVRRLPFFPFVTLGTLGLLVFLHITTPQYFISRMAISAAKMQSLTPFSPLWLQVGLGSQLLHLDDMHIYYNALSFLHKGAQLEHPRACGAARFAALLAVLTAATPVFYVALAALGSAVMPGLYAQQAVGFSGVIFGLKVVLQADGSGEEVVGGMRVPAKLAAWAELVAIQLATPNASFLGHLAGILAGLSVVALERAWGTARRR